MRIRYWPWKQWNINLIIGYGAIWSFFLKQMIHANHSFVRSFVEWKGKKEWFATHNNKSSTYKRFPCDVCGTNDLFCTLTNLRIIEDLPYKKSMVWIAAFANGLFFVSVLIRFSSCARDHTRNGKIIIRAQFHRSYYSNCVFSTITNECSP